jgi:hypothetical protein
MVHSESAVLFFPDGKTLVASGSQTDPNNKLDTFGEVRFLDVASGKLLHKAKTPWGRTRAGGEPAVAISPNGKYFVIGSDCVSLWNTPDFQREK